MRVDWERLLSDVRMELDNPSPHNPTDDLLMMKGGDEAQLLLNEMSNAPPGWSQTYHDLPVTPYKAIYDLEGIDNFSKPVRVHTIDPSDQYHNNRKIQTCERQNVDEFYSGAATASLSGWSAEVMVFYQEYNVHKVEVFPAPLDAVRYRLWFNTGVIPDPTREAQVPTPPEYFRFLRLKTSLAALPYCRWSNLSEQQANMKFKQLADALLKKEIEQRESWRNFIQTSRRGGSTEPLAYGQTYLDSWF